MKKHNRKMKQSPSHLEMAKELLLNEQKGYPKNLKLVEVKNSLSDFDKEIIKQAVLKAVENGCLEPELIADRCCTALERINKFGKNTGNAQCP
ncbi:hypothetical protein [Rodentibacter pneumotropicus]|uniref:hypothetical protein n=1 Tax=Rodentibacter pneumotropicus TaxID=758 RepID=UPI001EE1BE7A|nr:hypothetical protein [Rodentibacter pneumotropicus]